jgi:hypothetical protein
VTFDTENFANAFAHASTMRNVATDPISRGDDFEAVVARARRAAELAGELRPPVIGPYDSPLNADERQFLLGLVRDGTYARAVAVIAAEDPDLASE